VVVVRLFFAVVGTGESINRNSASACLGRNSALFPIVRPPLGQASREDWPSEPNPTPHSAF
jgi:hypothetical protein